jgi:hypothetical protein
MKSMLFSLMVLFCISAIGQSGYGQTNDSLYLGFYLDSIGMLERPNVIVVPFHPNRYLSEIDRYIAEGTNYSFQHTRGFFRKGLDNAILIGAKEHNDFVSMHADDPVVNEDLDFIYKVVSPSAEPYTPPVVLDDKGFKRKLTMYWTKIQTNVDPGPEPGTRVERGQIVNVADNRELITKARIYNEIVFDSLVPKYKGDYFLFVNELNLMNAAGSQRELESEDFNRLIKVHYSVFDKDGDELFSLVKKRYFSSYKNDLPAIITDEILPMGYDVMYALDSYRFLQAGLTPLTQAEVELAAARKSGNLSPLSKFK